MRGDERQEREKSRKSKEGEEAEKRRIEERKDGCEARNV